MGVKSFFPFECNKCVCDIANSIGDTFVSRNYLIEFYLAIMAMEFGDQLFMSEWSRYHPVLLTGRGIGHILPGRISKLDYMACVNGHF